MIALVMQGACMYDPYSHYTVSIGYTMRWRFYTTEGRRPEVV